MFSKQYLYIYMAGAILSFGACGCDSDNNSQSVDNNCKTEQPKDKTNCKCIDQIWKCDEDRPLSQSCDVDCSTVMDGYTCDKDKNECNCKGKLCKKNEICTSDGCKTKSACSEDCSTVLDGYTCDEEKKECNCKGTLCNDNEICTSDGCGDKSACSIDCNTVMDGYTCDEEKNECNCKGNTCQAGEICTQNGCQPIKAEINISYKDDITEFFIDGSDSAVIIPTLNVVPPEDVTLTWALDGNAKYETTCTTSDNSNQIILNAMNWNTGEEIICKGTRDDKIAIEDKSLTVNITSSSTANTFNNLEAQAEFKVKNANPANVIITRPQNLSMENLLTSESEDSIAFEVQLSAIPKCDILLSVSIKNDDDTTELYGTADKELLSFDYSNWNIPQTITVTGTDDGKTINTSAHSYTLTIKRKQSCPPFNNNPINLNIINEDNDSPNIKTNINQFTLDESDSNGKVISVYLSAKPQAKTTITAFADSSDRCRIIDQTGTILLTENLVFTEDNYNQPQSINVKPVNDNVDKGDGGCSIKLTATSTDTNPDTTYNGKSLTIAGTIIEDDIKNH